MGDDDKIPRLENTSGAEAGVGPLPLPILIDLVLGERGTADGCSRQYHASPRCEYSLTMYPGCRHGKTEVDGPHHGRAVVDGLVSQGVMTARISAEPAGDVNSRTVGTSMVDTANVEKADTRQ